MVPLLDLPRIHSPIEDELQQAAARVVTSGYYVLGPEVEALERELADYTGTRFCVSCASGSDALLLALMALDLQPGDAVITTPYTFFSTLSSITRLGGEVRLADIEPDTFNLDPEKLTPELAEGAKAIMPVHLFGQMADMDAINAFAADHGLAVIEDAAQAIGARWRDRPACSSSKIAATSFYPTKNLGGFGDGGALFTGSESIAEKLRVMRNHGMHPKYCHEYIGINSRMDAMQAALLRVKLRHLDEYAEGRRRSAERYRRRFEAAGVLSELTEGELSGVVLPVERPKAYHVYNQFVIRTSKRDALIDHLKAERIGCEVYYPIPLHLQPCFAELGFNPGDFPVSECAAETSLALPIFGELKDEEIDEVVAAIASFR